MIQTRYLIRYLRASVGVTALVATCCLPSRGAGQSVGGALTLSALLDTVAMTFPSIDAARIRIRAAEAGRQTAGAFSNPMLSYQVDNTPFPLGGQIAGLDREAMTMVTVPLEPLYQRGARVRQANALVQAATADAAGIRQQVLRDAAHAFYRVARAQARLDALQDVGEWLDTLVAYNRSRVQEGVTAEADLIRTQIERDRATIEVASQRAELARAQAELAAFTGQATNRALSVAVPGKPLTVDIASLGREPMSRAELRGAQARVDAADAGITSQRRMIFRELGATIGTKQTMGSTSMIAGFSLPIPLLDRNRGEVSRATAERDAARRDLSASTRMIQSEYAGALNAARILTDQATRLTSGATGDLLARAAQAERIALGAYREGAVSLLQVLDASRARSDARMSFYELIASQHEAVVDLLFAAGLDLRASLAHPIPELR